MATRKQLLLLCSSRCTVVTRSVIIKVQSLSLFYVYSFHGPWITRKCHIFLFYGNIVYGSEGLNSYCDSFVRKFFFYFPLFLSVLNKIRDNSIDSVFPLKRKQLTSRFSHIIHTFPLFTHSFTRQTLQTICSWMRLLSLFTTFQSYFPGLTFVGSYNTYWQ